MNKHFKIFLSIFLSAFIFSLLLSLFVYHSFSMVHFIDVLFYISGAITMIGFVMLIVRGGFFDGITHSFQKVMKTLARDKEEFRESTMESNFYLSERFTGRYANPILYSGLILTIFSIVVAYVL